MNITKTGTAVAGIERRGRGTGESRWLPAFLLSPAFIVILFVVAFPMLYSFCLSFTGFNLTRPTMNFVWFKNYIKLFHDPLFWASFGRTILFMTLAVNIEFILGLFIAHLMSRVRHGQGVIRTIIMIPMMFAPILVGFQFKWFFHDQVGLVNNFLSTIAGQNVVIAWLVDVPLGFITLLAAEIWMSTPFMVIILLAGLLSLPPEPFEAAEVDGASGWQKFRYITFPLLTPFIYIAMAVRSLDIARAYDVVRIMTGGGPGNRTELIWTYVFRLAITSNKFSLGCAMSYVTVAVSFLFTFYLFRQILKARKGVS